VLVGPISKSLQDFHSCAGCARKPGGRVVQIPPSLFVLCRKFFNYLFLCRFMQTFLPYPDFEKSFEVLDSRRLGKQRVEAFQILNILLNRTTSRGWRNHPAVLMWRGHANALKLYFNLCVLHWVSRGYKNNMSFEKIGGKVVFPSWFGDAKFHASHRSNLLRKDEHHYGKFGWKESDDLAYVWPKQNL